MIFQNYDFGQKCPCEYSQHNSFGQEILCGAKLNCVLSLNEPKTFTWHTYTK